MKIKSLSLAGMFAALSLLTACQDEQTPQAAAPTAFPPTPVAVITTKAEEIPITNELPGRIAPTRIAEVRPRATGIVIERVFVQGSHVNEGDVLYRIDPEPFKVQVASAEATLRRAKALQMQAVQEAQRQEELKKKNVTSTQSYDTAVATLAAANADVAAAEAGLAAAKLNLEYTNVTAPISGRIGRAMITEGALVMANGADNLATIQQLDPVYADFTQSASDLIRLRKALVSGGVMSPAGDAPVRLLMEDGSLYEHSGKLLFSEATVDATTGQVTLRGEFPNPEGNLLPGMYVRVLIEQGVEKDAIAIPQQAVQRNTAGEAQVYVIGDEDVAQLRTVKLDRVVDNTRWVVSSGLQPGERVIVEGFQKIRPGAKVAPQDWKSEAQAEQPQDQSQNGK